MMLNNKADAEKINGANPIEAKEGYAFISSFHLNHSG